MAFLMSLSVHTVELHSAPHSTDSRSCLAVSTSVTVQPARDALRLLIVLGLLLYHVAANCAVPRRARGALTVWSEMHVDMRAVQGPRDAVRLQAVLGEGNEEKPNSVLKLWTLSKVCWRLQMQADGRSPQCTTFNDHLWTLGMPGACHRTPYHSRHHRCPRNVYRVNQPLDHGCRDLLGQRATPLL